MRLTQIKKVSDMPTRASALKIASMETVVDGMKFGMRVAVGVYIGFIVYSVLLYLFGPSGLIAATDLEKHLGELEENIAELEATGRDLQQKRDVLLYDSGHVELAARSLGYFRSDETRIILDGSERSREGETIGRVTFPHPGLEGNSPLLRAIGFAAGLFTSIILALFKPNRRKHGVSANRGSSGVPAMGNPG